MDVDGWMEVKENSDGACCARRTEFGSSKGLGVYEDLTRGDFVPIRLVKICGKATYEAHSQIKEKQVTCRVP